MDYKKMMLEEINKQYTFYNDDLVVKNNLQELARVAIDAAVDKDFERGKVFYLTHTISVASEKEKCYATLKDVYVKTDVKNINEVKKYYVNVLEENLYILKIYVILSHRIFKTPFHKSLLNNTKYRIDQMVRDGKNIDMSYINYIYSKPAEVQPKNTDIEEDLIYTIDIFLPYNDRGYYMLGGNKYYNGYFLLEKSAFTSQGKLICEHGSHKSYLYEENGVLVHQVLGKHFLNPMIYEEGMTELKLKDIYADLDPMDWEIVKSTFEASLKIDKETLQLPDERIFVDITTDYMRDRIMTFFVERKQVGKNDEAGNTDKLQLSKYYSIVAGELPHLSSEIKKFLPTFANKKQKRFFISLDPEDFRKRWNPHPLVLVSMIKRKKQFTSFDKTNEADGFYPLSYIKCTAKYTGDETRKVRWRDMWLVDPISSPSSKNVGLSGQLVSVADMSIITD